MVMHSWLCYEYDYVVTVGMHWNEAIESKLDDALTKNRELEKQNTTLKSKVTQQCTHSSNA